VIEGLRSFRPGPEDNPGRMNVYDLRGVTVVIDLAHNEAGVEALLEVLHGLRPPGAVVHLVMGGVGDRTDDVLRGIGELGARGADRVAIAHKDRYLRGRTTVEMEELMREGAAAVGVHDVPAYPNELAALQAVTDQASVADVVGCGRPTSSCAR
jgi:cyanophycin synthetase